MEANGLFKKPKKIEELIEDAIVDFTEEKKIIPQEIRLSPEKFYDFCCYINRKSRQNIPKLGRMACIIRNIPITVIEDMGMNAKDKPVVL